MGLVNRRLQRRSEERDYGGRFGVFFKGVPGHEYPTALDLRAHYLN